MSPKSNKTPTAAAAPADLTPPTFPSPYEASQAALKSLGEAKTHEEYLLASDALRTAIRQLKTFLRSAAKSLKVEFPEVKKLKPDYVLVLCSGEVYLCKEKDIPDAVYFYDCKGVKRFHGIVDKDKYQIATNKWRDLLRSSGLPEKAISEAYELNFDSNGRPKEGSEDILAPFLIAAKKEQRGGGTSTKKKRKLIKMFKQAYHKNKVAVAFLKNGNVFYSNDDHQKNVVTQFAAAHFGQVHIEFISSLTRRNGKEKKRKKRYEASLKPKKLSVNFVQGCPCSFKNELGIGRHKTCSIGASSVFPTAKSAVELFFERRPKYVDSFRRYPFSRELCGLTKTDVLKSLPLESDELCGRCHLFEKYFKPFGLPFCDEPNLINLIVYSNDLDAMKSKNWKLSQYFQSNFSKLKEIAKMISEDDSNYGKRLKICALFTFITKYVLKKQADCQEFVSACLGYETMEAYDEEKEKLKLEYELKRQSGSGSGVDDDSLNDSASSVVSEEEEDEEEDEEEEDEEEEDDEVEEEECEEEEEDEEGEEEDDDDDKRFKKKARCITPVGKEALQSLIMEALDDDDDDDDDSSFVGEDEADAESGSDRENVMKLNENINVNETVKKALQMNKTFPQEVDEQNELYSQAV